MATITSTSTFATGVVAILSLARISYQVGKPWMLEGNMFLRGADGDAHAETWAWHQQTVGTRRPGAIDRLPIFNNKVVYPALLRSRHGESPRTF